MFRRPIIADPSRVVIYSKAAIALHNYLRTEESSVYCPPGFVDGEDGSGNVIDGAWRRDEVPVTGLESLRHVGGNRYNNLSTSLVDKLYSCTLLFLYYRHSRSAADIRDAYKDYFCSPAGDVSWQYTHIRRT